MMCYSMKKLIRPCKSPQKGKLIALHLLCHFYVALETGNILIHHCKFKEKKKKPIMLC